MNLAREPTGNGETNPSSLPPPPKTAMLIESLKDLAEDQGEDTDVIADMEMQRRRSKPADYGVFREHTIL